MFPIGDVTEFDLIVAFVACIAALSTGYWRLIVVGVSVPVTYFGLLSHIGSDELGLGVASYLILLAAALFGGLAWGWLVRYFCKNYRFLASGLAMLPGVAFAAFAIGQQYVPTECRNNGALISIANHTVKIPKPDGYWNYRKRSRSLKEYRWNKDEEWNTVKHRMAAFCRLTGNGTNSIEVKLVRIGQRYKNTEFNLTLKSHIRPDWDWNDFTRTTSYNFGNETKGAECYRRKFAGSTTLYCGVWDAPTPDFQIYAVTSEKTHFEAEEVVSRVRRDLSSWFNTLEID